MARIFWACWDGGGNLTPSLGIARELERRGHAVEFHGRPDMVDRVERADLTASALTNAYADLERYAFHPLPTVFGYTSSPTVGEEIADRVRLARPDVVVVDAMFSSALAVSPGFGIPTVVMLHTLFDRLLTGWRANFVMQSESRQRAGFDGLPDLDELWGERDALHVNALSVLDGAPATSWSNVVHGAPVLATERRAVPVELPWDDGDSAPIVLLSFSTVPEQRDVGMLQRALDALADLPVHVVATTGEIVDVAELRAGENAHLVPFADHDALMDRASLVLGHGGHGTTMRALRHGLPIVGMPARGADQAPITQLLEELKVGRAVPGDATTHALHAAVQEVLSDSSYAEQARRISEHFTGLDGASLAADTLERVLV